jgi:hypothetical protein
MIFEEFEGEIPVAKYQLEEDQVDDLNEMFDLFVEEMEIDRKEKLTYKELLDIFSVDERDEISDDFVRFLDYLAENCPWFDYQKDLMDKIKNDLSIIIAKLGIDYDEDEDEDFEFAQDDPNWPYEKEESDTLHGDEDVEDDEIEQLRQKSMRRYSEENDTEKRKEEIFNKLADGKPLSDEEKDFLSKMEKRKIFNFKRFNS